MKDEKKEINEMRIENLAEWEKMQKQVRDGKLSLRDFRNMKARIEYVRILEESEKAVKIETAFLRKRRAVWLPKSQIEIVEDKIYVPLWLIDKKALKIVKGVQ